MRNLVLEAVKRGLHALALLSPFFAQQACQGLRVSFPEENQLLIVHFVLRFKNTLAAEQFVVHRADIPNRFILVHEAT